MTNSPDWLAEDDHRIADELEKHAEQEPPWVHREHPPEEKRLDSRGTLRMRFESQQQEWR